MIKFKNHHSRRKGIKNFQKKNKKEQAATTGAFCTPVNYHAHFIEEESESPGNHG